MDEEVLQSQVELIREVFLYSNRYDGCTFVIQIGSNLVEDERFPTLVRDLAILQQSGIRLVLVPGAGKRIDEILTSYSITSRRVNGMRISPSDHMPLIKMAAFDIANMVMTQFSSQKVAAVIGNWVSARSIGVRDGIDFLDSGTVASVNVELLNKVMDDGLMPILPCIGWSKFGKPYNLSSLELASHLAGQLKAEKLFYISDNFQLTPAGYKLPTDGIVVRDGYIAQFTTPSVDRFLELNLSHAETQELQLLRHAALAAKAGVERVHIVNGRVEGVILKEIFSTIGQGTMIHTDPFENIRPMRLEDVAEVLHLMEPNIQKGILVKRDQDFFQDKYQDFVVFEADSTVRGCGALHTYGSQSAEIAGITVDPSFAHLGVGNKIIRFLVERAKQNGKKQVFLLTTQTGDYFESLGFHLATPDDLPPEKRASYNPARNSRVYHLDL